MTFREVFTDHTFLICLVIMFQFYTLILVFAFFKIEMDVTAKSTILQTFVIAYTAAWSFWIGSSVGSKMKDLKGTDARPEVK